jgi:hypothetical protein
MFSNAIVVCVREHLENPAQFFSKLFTLADDRRLLFAVTTVDSSSFVGNSRCERWRQFYPPTHLNYPTRDSLALFIHAAGGETLLHTTFGYPRPLEDCLGPFIGRKLLRRVNCGYRIPTRLNLYDIQFVIGRMVRA